MQVLIDNGTGVGVLTTVLLDNTGCMVTPFYDYHPITQTLIDSYVSAGKPQYVQIYKAWDTAIRSILAIGGTATYSDDFATTYNVGTGTADTTYFREDLIGATILSVNVEGIGVDQSNKITINTATGYVTYPQAYADVDGNVQYIKILYKK